MQLVCSKDLSGTPYMPGHMGGLGATRGEKTSFSDVMGTDLPRISFKEELGFLGIGSAVSRGQPHPATARGRCLKATQDKSDSHVTSRTSRR